MVENWYPTAEEGDKKGVLLVVTAGKEGALSGGKAFMQAVGDDLIDSIVSDNIPIFTEEDKQMVCLSICIGLCLSACVELLASCMACTVAFFAARGLQPAGRRARP